MTRDSTWAPADAGSVLRPSAESAFRERAKRFRTLAALNNGLGPFLTLMAGIADAQHALVASITGDILPPDPDHRKLPLATNGPLPSVWRVGLSRLLDELPMTEGPVGRLIGTLRASAPETLDTQARALISGNPGNLDRGAAALIAAALQVLWTVRAERRTVAPPLSSAEDGQRCPACGSRSVASLLLSGGDAHGARYLCCSLCATRWNLPRIRCVQCGASGRIGYFSIEGAGEAVRAEACDDCKAYTKILNREKQGDLDPIADDLATLTLDVMMAEAGYLRCGLNLFLIPGEDGRTLAPPPRRT